MFHEVNETKKIQNQNISKPETNILYDDGE